jgi:hypothetical protein
MAFGDAIETSIRRENAERFIEEVRGGDPELASYLRIEERELNVGWAELKYRRNLRRLSSGAVDGFRSHRTLVESCTPREELRVIRPIRTFPAARRSACRTLARRWTHLDVQHSQ